jgi:hypothetical protein
MPLEMVTPPKALRGAGGAAAPAGAQSTTYSEPAPFKHVASSMVPPQKRPSGAHLPSFQRFFGGSAGAPGRRVTAPVPRSTNARPVFNATSACSPPPPPQNSGARSTAVPTCSGTGYFREAKVAASRVYSARPWMSTSSQELVRGHHREPSPKLSWSRITISTRAPDISTTILGRFSLPRAV